MTPIDIVVPVSRDAEATQRCIAGVLASRNRAPFELVIVNDASPDAELVRYVRQLAASGAVTLIEQPVAQGYAAAVNRAFALHRDRDKVLLQSDAEVFGDWLDRLARHAAVEGIGVVATFTNAGGAATYPLPRADSALPNGYTGASLDALFAHANGGQSVVLPSVHGPCLYFRHECVASIGAFDGAPLGSDYGTEIDFCLRASSTGFRHLVAGDVFATHAPHASLGAEKAAELDDRTQGALAKLYPAYERQQAEQVKRDPMRTFARRVDLLRLAELPKQIVVFVSHKWAGGIRRYMNDLAGLIADRAEVLFLEPAVGDGVKLYWPRDGESFSAYFQLPDELPLLAEVLRSIGAARLHFHHVHGLHRSILDLPAAADLPFDCTLHDYFSICPQYHLVTESGGYCGEPDVAGCTACLARRPAQWGLDIVAWRNAFAVFLAGAQRLIAPSHDVAQRIRRYFPDLAISVWPHPESPSRELRRIGRIAILGNLSPGKGLNIVAACAEDARVRNLPLAFRVLGSTTEPVPQFPDAPLSIVGQYEESELAQLLVSEKADAILFPAQVPETYAYTLSVALASGLPIVASALGALPERLSGHPKAVTVAWDAPAHEWNAALMAAAGFAERPTPLGERVIGISLRAAS